MTSPALTASRCQCGGCGELFNSTSIFDLHRTGTYAKPGEMRGNRRCMTPAEMTARGYSHNAAGFWIREARQARTAHAQGPRMTLPATGVAA